MATHAIISTAPVLSDDRRYRRIGLLIVLIVFGGLGGWAALAPLGSAAVAPGIMVVENYRKTVQHLEGGIVKTIQVRDGDQVKADQILLTLDDTQPRAQLEVYRGQYFIALARSARLQAQRDGLAQIHYPSDLLSRRSDPRVRDAIRVQNQTFDAQRHALAGEYSLYERQIDQLQAKAEGLHAQKQSRDQLITSYQHELGDFEALLAEGYADKQKVRDVERNLSQREGESGELLADIAATRLQVNENQLKILQLQKNFQNDVAREFSEVQKDLFELREKVQSLESTVARTVVKAPQDGMVLGLAVHTIGAVLNAGGKILDIVPQSESLLVEAQVSPLDIDRVHSGQTAEVRLTAFKSRTLPRIEGRVVTVSADRLIDDKEKTAFYLVQVAIAPASLAELSRRQLALVPGMPAEVLINTGERTLFRYLTDPLKSGLARAFSEE